MAASYLFVLGLAQADRAGQPTLAWLAWLVELLRWLGRLIDELTESILVTPLFFLALGIAAALTLVLLRWRQRQAWQRAIALALLVPCLLATAGLVLLGQLGLAALAGLLAGICLAGCGGQPAEREPTPALLLVPVGLGLLLRFYGLAEFPGGYAQHAVVHHVDLSIPYYEALANALRTWQFQPFFALAAQALTREQFGLSSLAAASGFELFGVTLTVTRLVSAALGTLTIYVAYCLGRALDGSRLGLVFAFLLAASPWHITISRYGDQEHVLSPLQLLLSLLFAVLAVKHGRVRHIVLAALFTALAWCVYAANLVVPAIVGLFLLSRAVAEPGLALRSWGKLLLGLACFGALSYAPAQQLFQQGLFQPNLRTGYRESGSIISAIPKRSEQLVVETDQLFRRANDPWFSAPRGGIGLLQSMLLLPGLAMIVRALREPRRRDLALLVLIGLPIAALPAILAPDPSFRRLMLVATFIALAAALALVRLAEAARGAGAGERLLTTLACIGAIGVGASGAFGYFDRTVIETEGAAALQFRALGEAVAGQIGKSPLVVVVPRHDHERDAQRYIRLAAYDALSAAERQGVAQEQLYQTITCENMAEPAGVPAREGAAPMLVIYSSVSEPQPPCGPEFVEWLRARYPASAIVKALAPGPKTEALQ